MSFGEIMCLLWLGGLCFLLRPPASARFGRRWTAAWLGLISAAFILNQTRGALFAAAAGTVAIMPFAPRLRRWSLALAGAAVLVMLIWEVLPTGRSLVAGALRDGLEPIRNPQLDRLVFWDVAWRMFRDHPWLGVGPSNYHTLFDQYFQGEIAQQRVWGSAHNLYLHQLAERGLVGLIALVWLLGSLLSRAIARVRHEVSAWNLWALAATAGFLVMNLTEVAFQNEQVTSLFLFIWCWSEARDSRGRP